MLNRPVNSFAAADAQTSSTEQLWDVDRHPVRRLLWLFLLIALPLCAVTGRLFYLQGMRTVEVALPSANITTTHEPSASRDGRILAADGRILAYDVEKYHIRMHYRWLEEPPNERWLVQQTVAQFPEQQKLQKSQLAEAKQNILKQRAAVWQNLATISGKTESELAEKRLSIQQQVEHILESVKQRRQQKRDQQTAPPRSEQHRDSAWWQTAWDTVAETLTTPPLRSQRELLVIKEELDDHIVIEHVDEKIASIIEQHPQKFPGVRVQKTTQRTYPQGAVASHIIGYRSELHHEDITSRKKRYEQSDPLNYRIGDRIGKMGVEKIYDRALHGLTGQLRLVKNGTGEIMSSRLERKPQYGHDLILTLNFELQTTSRTAT